MTFTATGSDRSNDEGLGLIEIVVSMFVLALLAVAFLPLLIQGIKQSASNATLATATQIVNEQMELSRGLPVTCSAVTGFGAAPVPDTTDPRGVVLTTTRSVDGCPSAYPGTIRLAATVTRADTGDAIASASTLVLVERG